MVKKSKFKQVCPNKGCSSANIVANGTYSTRSGRVRKFICQDCGRVFSERTGTFLYDLRSPASRVIECYKLLIQGKNVGIVGKALNVQNKTVIAWIVRVSKNEDEVRKLLLAETPGMWSQIEQFIEFARQVKKKYNEPDSA